MTYESELVIKTRRDRIFKLLSKLFMQVLRSRFFGDTLYKL